MGINKLKLAGALLAGTAFPWVYVFGNILLTGRIWGIEPNPYILWFELLIFPLMGFYGIYLVLRRS